MVVDPHGYQARESEVLICFSLLAGIRDVGVIKTQVTSAWLIKRYAVYPRAMIPEGRL